MSEVYLDGEKVEFQGDAPESCADAIALIENYLGGVGRVVERVELDGVERELQDLAQVVNYGVLAFFTQSAQQRLASLCGQWSEASSRIAEEAETLASVSLRVEWKESQMKVVDCLERMRPIIEGVEVARGYGEESQAAWTEALGQAFQRGIDSINAVADAVESGDSVRVSDQLASEVAPSWLTLGRCLREDVAQVLDGKEAS
ncbi:hypothetical protein [Pelagicoccus sp. SDUM812003]|uniref:hypothetical protein n=1 Tax=Pelagicoccus sp. SDUM812003 TaxID=3041267 RepID=UPI00281016C1|nr:hypothetical protein [Pelagicoccus sp. SDUM812003]MDQ8201533.1 hypothetical protein [Pelagicoccus sp. SDUM812003]